MASIGRIAETMARDEEITQRSCEMQLEVMRKRFKEMMRYLLKVKREDRVGVY